MPDLDEPRQRAAETKRRRTREALLRAARPLFEERGWDGTRVEDVARDAGVGVATAYGYFDKQTLIGHVYAPLAAALLMQAHEDVAAGSDPLRSVQRHVADLARLCRRHHHLTVALIGAVQEQTIKSAGPPTANNDVRRIVPLPDPLIELIAYGQRSGVFRALPSADDVGRYHTNALVLRVLTRPDELPEVTAELVLSQLVPGLLEIR